MNYLITAAGRGSRLIKKGIKPPKPLVIVNGIELLIWSLGSFNFSSKDKLYIVTQKKDRVKEYLHNKIEQIYPEIFINWLELDEITNGQLTTAIKAIKSSSYVCCNVFKSLIEKYSNLIGDVLYVSYISLVMASIE